MDMIKEITNDIWIRKNERHSGLDEELNRLIITIRSGDGRNLVFHVKGYHLYNDNGVELEDRSNFTSYFVTNSNPIIFCFSTQHGYLYEGSMFEIVLQEINCAPRRYRYLLSENASWQIIE